MGWLDSLKAKTKDFKLSVAGRTTARAKSPRDLILQAIDASIAFLNDPKYRVTTGRRKGQEPDLVYSLDGTQATISLRYYRARLKLDGSDNVLTIDKAHLMDALKALRDGAANGEFDAQLDKIKNTRASLVKAGKSKNAK